MAFVSYTYDRYDFDAKQLFYTIIDSEFGECEVMIRAKFGFEDILAFDAAVAREYERRNLPVGRNLALLVLNHRKQRGEYCRIADLTRWQDEYCPKYMENGPEGTASGAKRWAVYAQERDHHLAKLTTLL